MEGDEGGEGGGRRWTAVDDVGRRWTTVDGVRTPPCHHRRHFLPARRRPADGAWPRAGSERSMPAAAPPSGQTPAPRVPAPPSGARVSSPQQAAQRPWSAGRWPVARRRRRPPSSEPPPLLSGRRAAHWASASRLRRRPAQRSRATAALIRWPWGAPPGPRAPARAPAGRALRSRRARVARARGRICCRCRAGRRATTRPATH